MSDIHEKIMETQPNLVELDCCNKLQVFRLGLRKGSDIAEAEVARLEDKLNEANGELLTYYNDWTVALQEKKQLEDVISDLNGIIAQYVTDEKRLEARVLELEERYRDLETLDALSDMPCTCTVEQENGDDPTVCRSCSATHAYNYIWEEIRMYVQSLSE